MRSPRISRPCVRRSASVSDTSRFPWHRALPGGSWFQAKNRCAAVPVFGGTVRVRGGRRKPVHGGLSKTSMFLTPPRTRPDPPSTGGRWPREIPNQPQIGSAGRWPAYGIAWAGQRPALPVLIFCGHRPTVEGGSGWVCEGVSRMDAATKPPWTGLRRPSQTHTVPPNQQAVAHRLFAGNQQQPGRARRYVACRMPARPGVTHPPRLGSSLRCRRCRSSRSGSWPGTAGGSPQRSSTPGPGTRFRW